MSHIFISYSRKDIDYAQKIVDALAANELDTWIDWQSIPKGEKWLQEIHHGIEEADAFLFLISPDAVESENCNKEIEHAVKNHKRIIPLVVRDAELNTIPSPIAERNWIFCRYEQDKPDITIDDFGTAIEEIRKTIDTDYEWLKFHTKLQTKALEWERNSGEESFLLNGKELQDVANIFVANAGKDPAPTELQRQYLLTSQEYEENLRSNEERRRRRVIIGLSLGLILVTVIGIFAWNQRNVAVNSEATTIAASTARATAELKAKKDADARATALINEKSARATAQANEEAANSAKATAIANETEAKRQAILALSENLSALALDRIDTDYAEALLLGVESYRLLQVNELDQGHYPDTLPVLLQKIPTGLIRTQAAPPVGGVHKILYSPDGNHMVTLSDTIDLWETGNPLSPDPVGSWNNTPSSKASDAAFSPDTATLAVGHQDGHVELWNIEGEDVERIASFDAFPPQSFLDVKVAISTDDKILAVAGNGTVNLFDMSSPGSMHEIGHVSHPHEGAGIDYLWFDPNFKNPLLVTGGQDKTFRVWNLKEASLRPSYPYLTIPRGEGIADIAISSKYLAVAGSQTIDIYYNFLNGFKLINSVSYAGVHRGLIESMSFSPSNARLFTAGQDGTVAEWDVMDPYRAKLIKVEAGHTNRVLSTAFHPSGNFIASGGNDSRVVFWDIRQETVPSIWQSRILSDAPITDLAYSPKTELLAIGNQSGKIKLWDLATPDSPSVRRSISIRGPAVSVAFNPDETELFFIGDFIASYNPTAYVRDITRLDYSQDRPIFETNTTEIFAPGNGYLLAGEISDGTLNVFQWRVAKEGITRAARAVVQNSCPFKDAVFARNGTLAAVAACTLQLWDFPGDQAPSLITELDVENPMDIALNSDGTLLVSANASRNSFSIWRLLKTGQTDLIKTQNDAHLNVVTSVAISPDEKMLATGSTDKSVILWDITEVENPVQRVIFQGHSSAILSGGLFFSADGKTLISASQGEVIVWDIDPQSWVERACNIAGRNFNRQEWDEYIGNEVYHSTCPQFPGLD